MLQKDLFDANVGTRAIRGNAEKAGFLQRFRVVVRLDQAVMAVIAFLMLDAVIFALGVEKGKHDVLRSLTDEAVEMGGNLQNESNANAVGARHAVPLPLDMKEVVTAPASEPVSTPAENTGAPVIVEISSGVPEGKFTIQLVTYKAPVMAVQKVEDLSKKGLQGFIIPDGTYQQICVNAFASREKAGRFLTQLKAQGLAPSDAYVRSIPA